MGNKDVIKIEDYTAVVPNEVYKQDIEIISPYNYVIENGIMKPEVIARHTKVFAFARFEGLRRAVLEKLVYEAERAASLHTNILPNEEDARQYFLKTCRFVPYIQLESNIHRVLLRLPYKKILQIINKTYAVLDSMNATEEKLDDTARDAEQLPDTLIIRFGEIACAKLETEETSNPFFSVGEQLNEAQIASRDKNGFSVHVPLKRGKLPDKGKLSMILSKAVNREEYSEIGDVLDSLFNHSASGFDSIELVPVRDLTADIIEECVFASLNQF